MKIAVVGATGLVGSEILKRLGDSPLQITEVLPVASERSVGKRVSCLGEECEVVSMEEAVRQAPPVAIFSAGGDVSRAWAPRFAEVGTTVVDNSSAWRMSPDHKLIVPEINAGVLTADDRIIANPNCSTIQMVLALHPLHRRYTARRVVVATYQSVTGTGKAAVDQLFSEREKKEGPKAYPYPIDLNLIPHIDVFLENGYTKEEMKMVNETKKILDDRVQVTATAVRVPVLGGHSEAVNVEFEEEFDLEEVRALLRDTPGVVLADEVSRNEYPMPITAHGRDEVFVGRLRRDETQPRTLNMWVVADNLRKGAATNAIQIVEYLVASQLVAVAGRPLS